MPQNHYYDLKPGIHSFNAARRLDPPTSHPLNRLRLLLLLVGVACLGYYGYTIANQQIYQVYENWAFDQQIAGRSVTFSDYLRAKTPFGFLAGAEAPPATAPAVAPPVTPTAIPIPPEGAVIGKVAIERLNLSAVVRQGVSAETLSLAVGHVPSTALPGQDGNFAIAAHRDTLFRVLKDIRIGDTVTFQSSNALYRYQVVATKIVKPSDVSVLQPNGGGLLQDPPKKLLTMITCYPFYYVGAAPKRFIVEAKLLKDQPSANAMMGTE